AALPKNVSVSSCESPSNNTRVFAGSGAVCDTCCACASAATLGVDTAPIVETASTAATMAVKPATPLRRMPLRARGVKTASPRCRGRAGNRRGRHDGDGGQRRQGEATAVEKRAVRVDAHDHERERSRTDDSRELQAPCGTRPIEP